MAAIFTISLFPGWALAQVAVETPVGAAPAVSAFDQLSLENAIIGKGKTPFHLKMSFQVYSFEGKPEEEGTVEEWWSESDGSRLDITAPSFGTVHSTEFSTLPNDRAKRSLFLVKSLLADASMPLNNLINDHANSAAEDKNL